MRTLISPLQGGKGGAEHHRRTDGLQRVARGHHQGRRRVALEKNQAGQQVGQLIVALGELAAESGLFPAQRSDVSLGCRDERLARLNESGRFDQLDRDCRGLVIEAANLAGQILLAQLGAGERPFDRLKFGGRRRRDAAGQDLGRGALAATASTATSATRGRRAVTMFQAR